MNILIISYWDFMEHGIAVTRLTPTFFGEQGHKVTFMTHPEMTAKPASLTDLHANVKVVRFDMPLKSLSKIPKLGRLRQLFLFGYRCWHHVRKDMLGEKRPDVIYAAECDAILVGRVLAKMLGVPLVTRYYGISTILLDRPLQHLLYWMAVRTPAELAIVTNDGTDGQRQLETHNKDLRALRFWCNGVDIRRAPREAGQSVRSELGLRPETAMLLWVSRLYPWKRTERAINAMAKLVRDGNADARLVVIGHGGESEYLRELAADLQIADRVIFPGAVHHDDVARYYAAADVFLSCYDMSNVGNTLLEALASELPVVTLNTGRTADFIANRVNGLNLELAETEDETAQRIADGVAEILEKPELRKRLSEGAKAYAQEHFWSWDERLAAELSAIQDAVGAYRFRNG